jgi:hypothetical protein
MSVHRSAVSTTDQRFGSRCSGWRLIGKRHEPHRWPALDSADGEVPYARKKSQFRAHSFSELYSHLLVDVEVFLTPNDLHGRLEPGKLRFEVILVSRKVRVVVGERVFRRHRSLGPSSEQVVLELTRNFKMLFLGQTSREGVLQDLVAIAVQVGADLIHRRSLLQALQARVHELGPVERGEIAHDERSAS